ncbi:sugar transferase [Sporolactobacillus sp. THM7-4]|nr:sugar transferase [Sporolactobacillus sp. THM7-4]
MAVKPPKDKTPFPAVNGKAGLPQQQVNLKSNPFYLFVKRTMDLFGALTGLIVLLPIFLVIALLIKWTDPVGPVIFKQVRIGRNGKPFRIYKFRSMVHNAEDLLGNLLNQNETNGPMFKMKNDPRVTRIGRFLRRTSLDEFPQLVNVLKGEMSLVGPRPPLPREVNAYTERDKQRLLVKPGCTGLWQVEGRSNIGFETMVQLDLEYIHHRNILLDLKIILKTIPLLFHSNNAY